MISNEAVQRLIACDRETLIALMAAAIARGGGWDIVSDPDIRTLIEAARVLNTEPSPWAATHRRMGETRMKPDRMLDVGPALFGGYRVALLCGLRCDGQALFETAHDVAAEAALMGVAVLSSDADVIAACRALGVATALPPPGTAKSDGDMNARH